MSSNSAIVVGAGIFGCTIARALARAGWEVRVLDDERPFSGSAPSGCLMKPSWFSTMGPTHYEPALKQLDELYRLRTVQMTLWPTRVLVPVYHVPAAQILDLSDLRSSSCTVKDVRVGRVEVENYGETETLEADLVVVAAGVWCGELLSVDGLEAKRGVSFRWSGSLPRGNLINPWAPYKQLVAFEESPGQTWAGDGSALKPGSWTSERVQASVERVRKYTGMPIQHDAIIGDRPYVKQKTGQPCLLEERAAGLWLATGGAKNGTVAAGWAAHEIVRRTS